MTEAKTIRVLVVDDHPVVREGICSLLETKPDIEVVGEASNGREAVTRAEALKPDVILMDIMMPDMDGIQAIKEIVPRLEKVSILVLTSFAGDNNVFPALKAGAAGYLLKDSGPRELVEAVRQVHRGESSLHPVIARRVLQELLRPSDRPEPPEQLTERELEVLKLLGQGKLNHEIAAELVISDATVRTHVSNILAKLQLASRTQAALYAVREGLASLEPRGG